MLDSRDFIDPDEGRELEAQMLTLLEAIDSWISDETDKKIRGQRPDWAGACCHIWHEIGTPLVQLRVRAAARKGVNHAA